VDTRLDENETELGVLVLAVALKVLADSDSLHHNAVNPRALPPQPYHLTTTRSGKVVAHLLDQHVKILGNLRGEAFITKKSLRQFQEPSRGIIAKTHGTETINSAVAVVAVPFDFKIRRILFPTPLLH